MNVKLKLKTILIPLFLAELLKTEQKQ